MADTKATVEKLNDGNYAVWKFKMRLLLTKEKLLKVVTDPKPTTADAAWISDDEKAQALIGLALEDTQLIHVMTKETAKEMWDALKDYHERSSLSSIIHVVRQLITMRMAEDGSMAEHLKQMTALRLRLTALGEEVKDNWFVALMLSSLPRSYDGLIVALESRPDADLTVDFVKGHTRKISIPDCVEFSITTNACRGFCESFAVPSDPFAVGQHKPSQPVTSVGQCCNIMETEDVKVRVLCVNGIRNLTFKSATNCSCYHCKKD